MADKDQSDNKSNPEKQEKGSPERNQTGNNESSEKIESSPIELLKNDHRQVEQLFSQFEQAARRADKDKLARQICIELIIHTMLEEEIFYPACRSHADDDKLDEAQVEHDGAKTIINELMSQPAGSPYFDAKVKVLSEMIKHHVAEEEKRSEGIFFKAKAGGVDTAEIAKKLQERKSELTQQALDNRLQRPRPRSFRAYPYDQTELQMKEDKMASSQYRGRYADEDDDRRMRSQGRDRDEFGRFSREDDAGQSSRSQPSHSSGGRYRDEDDDRRSSRSQSRERDENGRFMSDDDRDGRMRSQGMRSGGGRSRQDDDDRRDDDRRGGWFGDSEGHSQASRMGWRNSDHEGSGWYGDSQGHADASRRGWESRDSGNRSRSRDDDDDRSYRPQAARGGGGGRSRHEEDEDDRRSRSGSRSQNHGGWFGDSEGHSEASRRGWENRR